MITLETLHHIRQRCFTFLEQYAKEQDVIANNVGPYIGLEKSYMKAPGQLRSTVRHPLTIHGVSTAASPPWKDAEIIFLDKPEKMLPQVVIIQDSYTTFPLLHPDTVRIRHNGKNTVLPILASIGDVIEIEATRSDHPFLVIHGFACVPSDLILEDSNGSS